jgi:adenylate cyclase
MVSASGSGAPGSAAERTDLARLLKRRLTLQINALNMLGATLVLVFLLWIVPVPVPRREGELLNVIVAVAYALLSSLAGQLLGGRTGGPIIAWLSEGRMPDAHEREVTLRQPLLQARNVAILWVGAAVVFAGVNVFYSAALALEIVVTVVMGGVVATALTYLLAERIERPVMALALADEPPTSPVIPGVVTRSVLAWASGTAVAVIGAALVAAEYLAADNMSPTRLAVTVLFLCVAALTVGLATTVFAARSLSDPLDSIRHALAEVESGNTDVEVPVFDGNEVGLLQAGFNSMVAGLREREQIRDLFGRHVGHDVARQALARGISLGGETREAAVLFVDLVGSTALAATEDPAVVVAALNRFFAVVVAVVDRHGGWVNKFEGDAALCVFGALEDHPEPAASALAAGRELSAALRGELPTLAAGIGLASGRVVAGNIGAADRYEYTVIGDPVNAAARLADLAKLRPERVLANEAIVRQAGSSEAERWQLREAVTLRGRPTPTRIAVPVG